MKNDYKPLIVAVFLVVAGLILRGWHPSQSTDAVKVIGLSEHPPVLVGVAEAQGVETADPVVVTDDTPGDPIEPTYTDAAIQDPGQPVGQVIDPSQTLQYTVKNGDTLSGIAAHFNVSVANILSANPNINKKVISVGSIILIPGAASTPTSQAPALPNFNGDFIMPAQGDDYGVLDDNNGVDIVNSCGTPVVAAADGIVVPDANISDPAGGWNDGYGNFVLTEQAFGNEIFTRYSHLGQSLVQIGDYVKQGQEIGLIGQTGEASMCELNFQVIGAQNPFAK